jgi:hypothetical protein
VGKEGDTFFQLHRHRFCTALEVGAEALVIAIGATANPFVSIPVWTRETSINGYLLYFVRENFSQKVAKIIVWLSCHFAISNIAQR